MIAMLAIEVYLFLQLGHRFDECKKFLELFLCHLFDERTNFIWIHLRCIEYLLSLIYLVDRLD